MEHFCESMQSMLTNICDEDLNEGEPISRALVEAEVFDITDFIQMKEQDFKEITCTAENGSTKHIPKVKQICLKCLIEWFHMQPTMTCNDWMLTAKDVLNTAVKKDSHPHFTCDCC